MADQAAVFVLIFGFLQCLEFEGCFHRQINSCSIGRPKEHEHAFDILFCPPFALGIIFPLGMLVSQPSLTSRR